MMKLLLAVASVDEREPLAGRLERNGLEVLATSNGSDAIALMKAHEPDIAVIDRRLPDTDGLDVAGWARDHVKLHRVPVILLVEPEDLNGDGSLVQSGAVDVLVKPVRLSELVLRIAMRANNEERFAGLFAGNEANRLVIQESLAAYLEQHRDREEEVLGLLFTDPETGLNNRAYFKIKMSEELKRAQRYDLPLSALLIKLSLPEAEDGTDAPGVRPLAAMTLKEIAGILLLESRDLDIIGRFCHSDFSLLLPSTLQDGAVLLAQRISERIITHRFSDNVGGRDFQVRIGVATHPTAGIETPNDLMNRAYEALYKAQHFGNKEICIWEAGGV